MVKKQNKSSRRMKDTNAQKRRKKRLAHFGGKEQPMEFCHAAINAEWDRSKTLKQNYTAMGLATNPNRAMPIKKTDVQRKLEQADKEVTISSGVLDGEQSGMQRQRNMRLMNAIAQMLTCLSVVCFRQSWTRWRTWKSRSLTKCE